MKKIFLLSTLVLTQTIFATTLTIYNSNIALVHESHEFTIQKQDEHFVYNNLPNTIIDDSVNINFPSSVTLYSQVYKRKTLTLTDLAKHFIGKELQLKNDTTVKLITLNGNTPIVQSKDGKVFLSKISEIVFPYLPNNLETQNALDFQIKAKENLTTNIDISYLARNISFTSDYILNINKNKASFQGWIDITNNSGKDFKNTKVNLIAGDINRAYTYNAPVAYKSMVAATQDSPIAHKAIAGYHKYTLPFTVNLNAFEKRRVKLLEYKNITIKNHYLAKMSNPIYLMGERSSSVSREITLKRLDKALPGGKVRIYTKDDNEVLLLGEQSLRNTPKNTPLTLRVGKDFDTKVIQKVLSRTDTNKRFNVTIEYIVTNHSDEDKTITIEIPFYKRTDSKVISKEQYHYENANLLLFKIFVKANSHKSFKAKFISKRR